MPHADRAAWREVAEPDPGGGGRGGRLGRFQVVMGGLNGGVKLVDLLVSQERGVAGGLRSSSRLASRPAPATAASSRRVACRSVTCSPLRGPSVISRAMAPSDSSYSWPRSSVQVSLVNAGPGRSAAGPLR